MNKIILTISCALTTSLHAQLVFTNADSLLSYADRYSTTSQVNRLQEKQAAATKNAALANIINFRNPVSLSMTDNVQLPVNFIPAEVFGGPAGSFREITLGQEYVTNFNFNPQVDLINPYNWSRVKAAEINKELVAVSGQLSKKALYENLSAGYYNIVSLQEQVEYATRSKSAADSILLIAKNKLSQGIVRAQDANNASVLALNLADRLSQLQSLLDQQVKAVSLLAGIPKGAPAIFGGNTEVPDGSQHATGQLATRAAMIQADFASHELRSTILSMLPVLSLFYYQGWQKNSNTGFGDDNASWIQSRYLGFRITMPFPPDVNKISQSYNAKINSQIAGLQFQQLRMQGDLDVTLLDRELERAISTFRNAEEIFQLKKSNYTSALDQNRQGILPLEALLTAFTEMMNANAALSNARAVMMQKHALVTINNKFK